MDLIWNTPVAATDAWVGRLDGSLITGDSSCVTHLIVRRGLLVRTRYAVPIESLARADSDGLFLDLLLAKVRGMPRPEEAGASGASYTPGTRVVAADGAVLRLKGIRASEDATVTHLVIGRPGRVCPIGEVTLGEGQSLSLPLSRGDVARLPAYRPDDGIGGRPVGGALRGRGHIGRGPEGRTGRRRQRSRIPAGQRQDQIGRRRDRDGGPWRRRSFRSP